MAFASSQAAPAATTSAQSSLPPGGLTGPVPKRQRIPRACDSCRRKKIRCNLTSQDASRPPSRESTSDGQDAASTARCGPASTSKAHLSLQQEEAPVRCANCRQSGIPCTFTKSPAKRGPNKGQISLSDPRTTASQVQKNEPVSPEAQPVALASQSSRRPATSQSRLSPLYEAQRPYALSSAQHQSDMPADRPPQVQQRYDQQSPMYRQHMDRFPITSMATKIAPQASSEIEPGPQYLSSSLNESKRVKVIGGLPAIKSDSTSSTSIRPSSSGFQSRDGLPPRTAGSSNGGNPSSWQVLGQGLPPVMTSAGYISTPLSAPVGREAPYGAVRPSSSSSTQPPKSSGQPYPGQHPPRGSLPPISRILAQVPSARHWSPTTYTSDSPIATDPSHSHYRPAHHDNPQSYYHGSLTNRASSQTPPMRDVQTFSDSSSARRRYDLPGPSLRYQSGPEGQRKSSTASPEPERFVVAHSVDHRSRMQTSRDTFSDAASLSPSSPPASVPHGRKKLPAPTSILGRLDKSSIFSLDSPELRRAVFSTPAQRTFAILPQEMLQKGLGELGVLVKAAYQLATSSSSYAFSPNTVEDAQWQSDLSNIIGQCMRPITFMGPTDSLLCRETEALLLCYCDSVRRGRFVPGILGAASGKLALLERRGYDCRRYRSSLTLLSIWHGVAFSSRILYLSNPHISQPDEIYDSMEVDDPSIRAICIFTSALDTLCRRYTTGKAVLVPPDTVELALPAVIDHEIDLGPKATRLLAALDSYLLLLNFLYNQTPLGLPNIDILEKQRHHLYSIVNETEVSGAPCLAVGPHMLSLAAVATVYCLAVCRNLTYEVEPLSRQTLHTLQRDYLAILDNLKNMTEALSLPFEASHLNRRPYADPGDTKLLSHNICKFLKLHASAVALQAHVLLNPKNIIVNLDKLGYIGYILSINEESPLSS